MLRVALLVAIVGVWGCDEKKPAPKAKIQLTQDAPVVAAAADPAAEAKEIFNTRCSVCHGLQGKGDGAAAAALNPKPRDMSDGKWQKSVDDAHIKKTIVEGGAAVGKSSLMAANPDLKDKGAVLEALVKHLRSLGQ